jgi:tetratricopeptide (TPR) repeat protein
MRSALAVFFALLAAIPASALDPAADATRRLALDLVTEKRHEPAAVEFRRMALMSSDQQQVSMCYWAAAYEYMRAGDYPMTARMLDLAEGASAADNDLVLLLRGETAIAQGNNAEAVYFMQGLLSANVSPEQKSYASVRLARTYLSQKQTDKALDALAAAGRPLTEQRAAVVRYAKGRDRKPWLGGLLGLIPGLGHAYSGEYANGFRALILNSLFIYGMVETADAEAWGGFAVISFFELTWYTGSIYGGVDAAHRFNRNRMEECLRAIDEGASFVPSLDTVPALTLNYEF